MEATSGTIIPTNVTALPVTTTIPSFLIHPSVSVIVFLLFEVHFIRGIDFGIHFLTLPHTFHHSPTVLPPVNSLSQSQLSNGGSNNHHHHPHSSPVHRLSNPPTAHHGNNNHHANNNHHSGGALSSAGVGGASSHLSSSNNSHHPPHHYSHHLSNDGYLHSTQLPLLNGTPSKAASSSSSKLLTSSNASNSTTAISSGGGGGGAHRSSMLRMHAGAVDGNGDSQVSGKWNNVPYDAVATASVARTEKVAAKEAELMGTATHTAKMMALVVDDVHSDVHSSIKKDCSSRINDSNRSTVASIKKLKKWRAVF